MKSNSTHGDDRKPVSLNDSHYRLLQDLSAPPKSSLEEEVDEEKEEIAKVKIEGRRRLCKAAAAVSSSARGGDVVSDETIPSFNIADFDSPPGVTKEEKPEKVKIRGRRRLCKVSCQDKESAEAAEVENGPSFSHIVDFDSPPVPKSSAAVDESIRDILNDLTSRLDFLSIDKKKVPASSVASHVEKAGNVDKPEFGTAESSFSGVSEGVSNESEEAYLSSESMVDDNVDKDVHDIKSSKVMEDVEDDFKDEGDNYVTELPKPKQIGQREKQHEPKMAQEKLRTVGRSSAHCLIDDDDDEDDCVVWSHKNVAREAGKHNDKSIEPSNDPTIVDLSDDDDVDDAKLKDEASFTLSGPKSTYNLPSKIAKMLYPHQREGLRWLWSLHCLGKGGILGDDMGLGKTMQICGFLAGLFHSKLIKRVMVVAPKTLLSHWIKELSVVGLSSMTREYFGTSTKARQYELQYILQDKGILLTTYDIVRTSSKSLRGNYYDYDDSEDGCIWDYMILDEGHLIKNPSTQRAKSLLEIPSAHRIVISGTPIQNNLKELWALFNFCCPDLLGDHKWFKEKYEHKILRGNEKNATDREKRIGSSVAKELRDRIQPYFLRRLKNEVFKEDDNATAKLSRKNELIVWLKLTTCQRQLYEAFLQSELVLSAFDGSPLAALTILKKICDHPLILTKRAAEDVLEGMESLNPDDANVAEELAKHVADAAGGSVFEENHDKLSCKISFILSLLSDLIPKGHHVLIFSQTRKMLNCIQESLSSKGYNYLRIDGTTKANDRVRIVEEFQEGNTAPIFLLTSLVGGLGLTLTKADRVIVVDPAWNPSTDNQSVDRAYRIGQKKDVIVYRLMTCGTVEEKIYRKQIFKGGLFKSATEQKEQIRYFSQQDLRDLFSLPKQGFAVSVTQKQLHEEHDSQHAMDDSLGSHIKFLETQGIAGVSHHSLLFSKTAPVEAIKDNEDEPRRKATTYTFYGNSSSSRAPEHEVVDGAMYAFSPKDVRLNKQSPSPSSDAKLTESEIKARISRLSQILANKATVSKLPDQGAKIQKQIQELKAELNEMMNEKKPEKSDVIDLDDLTEDLQRVLNV